MWERKDGYETDDSATTNGRTAAYRRRAEGAVNVPETEAATDEEESRTDDHLAGLEDGAGCTEIWERLSEQRASEQRASDD